MMTCLAVWAAMRPRSMAPVSTSEVTRSSPVSRSRVHWMGTSIPTFFWIAATMAVSMVRKINSVSMSFSRWIDSMIRSSSLFTVDLLSRA